MAVSIHSMKNLPARGYQAKDLAGKDQINQKCVVEPGLQELYESSAKLQVSLDLSQRVLHSDLLKFGARTAVLVSFAVGVVGTASVASVFLGEGSSLLTAGLASAPFALGGLLVVPKKITEWMHRNPDVLPDQTRREFQKQAKELLESGRQLCAQKTAPELEGDDTK